MAHIGVLLFVDLLYVFGFLLLLFCFCLFVVVLVCVSVCVGGRGILSCFIFIYQGERSADFDVIGFDMNSVCEQCKTK